MSRSIAKHEHTFTNVVRQRGLNVRYGCDDCPKIGPWIKLEKRHPIRVEKVDEYGKENQPEVNWDSYTRPVLCEMAKARGLVGYSKWTKPTLIQHLQEA